MAVKNLMEDIVAALVEEVLGKTSKDGDSDARIYREDIITYVLNRIPPKYYTSERGILHGKLEAQFVFQQKTDILLLTYEALKTVKKRRSSELSVPLEGKIKEYFFPHILGEVLEETTFSVIPNVEVTILYKDEPAEMIDQLWKNPYVTNKATKGFFHFWPKLPEKDLDNINKTKNVKFEIVCTHPQFNSYKLEFELAIVENRNVYKSFIMPMILLKKLDGVDLMRVTD